MRIIIKNEAMTTYEKLLVLEWFQHKGNVYMKHGVGCGDCYRLHTNGALLGGVTFASDTKVVPLQPLEFTFGERT